MYNKYCNTVLMNYWDITHTHCLLKRSLMRSHPVSGNSGLPMCCGKVCAGVLSDACTQVSVNPRRALRGPRCEPPGPFASVPPHKSCCLAVHINKLLNQRMRETRPEGMRACRSLFQLARLSFIGIHDEGSHFIHCMSFKKTGKAVQFHKTFIITEGKKTYNSQCSWKWLN